MKTLEKVAARLDIELRDYQQRLAEKALQMYGGPFRDRFGRRTPTANSILLESPTGSGKTVIGLLLARCLQLRYGFRVGWVAMRRNLLAQAAAENAARGFGVEMHLISMFDSKPPKVDFLVVDEAQHDGAMSMATLHANVRPKKVLGLTATPFRSDRVKLCFEHVIQDIGIEQLIQAGHLSRFRHFTIPTYSPEAVTEHFIRDRRRWGKSLLFFHRLQQCLACRDLLAAAGIAAEVVTGQSDRERQIQTFASGKINVLISMAILAEGFDCPSLKTVFCRPSGRGCTIQMCGRAFRKYSRLRYKQIVQCRHTRHPITRTATASEQYIWMDGTWRSLAANEHLSAISARTLQVLAQCAPQLPDVVAGHIPSRHPSLGPDPAQPFFRNQRSIRSL
jgi:superfamily II DNA or RNA helicase